MDNRLDFYNYLRCHKETLSDDDVLIVVAYNTKQKDCVIQTHGELNKLTPLLLVKNVRLTKETELLSRFNLTTFILEAALEVCKDNSGVEGLMVDELIKHNGL